MRKLICVLFVALVLMTTSFAKVTIDKNGELYINENAVPYTSNYSSTYLSSSRVYGSDYSSDNWRCRTCGENYTMSCSTYLDAEDSRIITGRAIIDLFVYRLPDGRYLNVSNKKLVCIGTLEHRLNTWTDYTYSSRQNGGYANGTATGNCKNWHHWRTSSPVGDNYVTFTQYTNPKAYTRTYTQYYIDNQSTNYPFTSIVLDGVNPINSLPSMQVTFKNLDNIYYDSFNTSCPRLILDTCSAVTLLNTKIPIELKSCDCTRLKQSSSKLILFKTNCSDTGLNNADVSYGVFTGSPAFTSNKVNILTAGVRVIDKNNTHSTYTYDPVEIKVDVVENSSSGESTTVFNYVNPPIKLDIDNLNLGISAAIESIDWSKVAEGLMVNFNC